MFEVNWLIGAAPGQGKTSAVHVLACGAVLDPGCDLWGTSRPAKATCSRSRRSATATRPRSMTSQSATPRSRCGCCGVSWSTARPRSRRSTGRSGQTGNSPGNHTSGRSRSDRRAASDAAHVIRLGRAYGIVLVLATQV
jgi:DNA segregation ATPase FtsK/SpoIIIE, S-DNA-T family